MSHRGEEIPDLPIYKQELARSDIDSLQLAHYLHDSKENFERIQGLSDLYLLDPVVRYQFHEYNDTREQRFEAQAKRLARLKKITQDNNLPPVNYVTSEEYGPPTNTLMPTSLHHSMFETVLRILGSEEQVTEYLPKVLSYEVLG